MLDRPAHDPEAVLAEVRQARQRIFTAWRASGHRTAQLAEDLDREVAELRPPDRADSAGDRASSPSRPR